MKKIICIGLLYIIIGLAGLPGEERAANQPVQSTPDSKDKNTSLTLDEAEIELPGETGYASWYAGKFQGRQTASGEIFDTNQLTAAHKTLPFNTIVKVTNLKNNLAVIVRINDRGPFIPGRIIDLSRAAAEKIGMISMGIAKVRVEIIGTAAVQEVYTIQVASFADKAKALKLQERLEAQLFAVTLEETEMKLTRVLLKQLTKEEAENAKTLLAKWGFYNILIKKITVIVQPGTENP